MGSIAKTGVAEKRQRFLMRGPIANDMGPSDGLYDFGYQRIKDCDATVKTEGGVLPVVPQGHTETTKASPIAESQHCDLFNKLQDPHNDVSPLKIGRCSVDDKKN